MKSLFNRDNLIVVAMSLILGAGLLISKTQEAQAAEEAPIGYDTETQDGYNFAYENGITTLSSFASANPYGPLSRKHAAKMFVELAIALGKTTAVHEKCLFMDIGGVDSEMYAYIMQACRLGLMGQKANGTPAVIFSPDAIMTRAQFGTALSRMLYGDTYNSSDPANPMRYSAHLQAMQDAGYMKVINNPQIQEERVYVWIMFMRVYKAWLAEREAYEPNAVETTGDNTVSTTGAVDTDEVDTNTGEVITDTGSVSTGVDVSETMPVFIGG